MKFNNLNIPTSITEKHGLKEINLSNLGRLIILVGKNGAGKTRFLNCLKEYVSTKISETEVYDGDMEMNLPQLNKYKKTIEASKKHDKTLQELVTEKQRIMSLPDSEQFAAMKKLELKRKELTRFKSKNSIVKLLEDFAKEFKEVVPYLVKPVELKEINSIDDSALSSINNFAQQINSVNPKIDINEFQTIKHDSLIYFTSLPHLLVKTVIDSTINKSKFEESEPNKIYLILKRNIKIFLDKNLEFKKFEVSTTLTPKGATSHHRGYWNLDGRQFEYTALSDGEKTLFFFALYFFLHELNPERSISKSILTMDEPEIHLHADAQINLLKSLETVIKGKGQLFICTHSIPIIASSNFSNIYVIRNGEITPPNRRNPKDALSEILSKKDFLSNVSSYLNSISAWMYKNFMMECFEDPKVISKPSNTDPQVQLFIKSLKERRNLKVLDFGVGEGRVLNSIPVNSKKLGERFSVFDALDTNIEKKEQILEIGYTNYYTKLSELKKNHYDFILICNVLHEIPISQWSITINTLIDSLKSNGMLIIIELNELKVGEYIQESGFMLTTGKSLQKLFTLKSVPIQIIHNNPIFKDRINCTPLSKKVISKISTETILSTCNEIKKEMMGRMDELQNIKLTPVEKGRKHAFYSQQYINAVRAIRTLG